jgi:hypothetical protein
MVAGVVERSRDRADRRRTAEKYYRVLKLIRKHKQINWEEVEREASKIGLPRMWDWDAAFGTIQMQVLNRSTLVFNKIDGSYIGRDRVSKLSRHKSDELQEKLF